MQFSIIVPVYNIEDWLETCVMSLLSQTYSDYEVLLVDDGSTDHCGRMCDEYMARDARIRSFHKENGGLSDARNYGIVRAQGEYLIFLDGDDYLGEYALEWLHNEVDGSSPDVILSEGKYVVTGTQVQMERNFCRENFIGLSGKEALLLTSKITPNWSAWGKCYRTEFWRKHEFRFAKGRISEDFQLIDKVLLEAETVSMVPCYYYYQYRANSIVHSVKVKTLDDILLSMQEWKAYLNEAKLDSILEKQLLSLQAELLCHSVLGYICLVDSGEQRRLLEKSKEYMSYLKCSKSTECRIIFGVYKIIGIKNTCRIIGTVKKRRLKEVSK